MKKNLHDKQALAARLSGYATAAGALIALAPTADGQVIYSGTQNIQLNMPDAEYALDLDGDMVDDFIFQIYGFSSIYTYTSPLVYVRYASGWANIINAKTDSYKNSWIYRNTYVTYTTYNSTYGTLLHTNTYPMVDGLGVGVEVGSSQYMWKNPSYLAYSGILGYGSVYSYWGAYSGINSWGYGDFFGEELYIGVRFWIGVNQHYGWIRASLGDYIDPMTIIDWAYESTPGASILTGAGDYDGPVAVLDAGVTTTLDQTVTLSLTFEETAYGFGLSDLDITNGTAHDLEEIIPGKEYTFEVTANDYGQVTVELPAGSVTDYPGNENALASETWVYQEPIAVDAPLSQGIKMYPNPAENILNINLETLSEIRITDLNGKLVYQQENVMNESIDVSRYNPGVYIVQVTNDEAVTQHKVVIK